MTLMALLLIATVVRADLPGTGSWEKFSTFNGVNKIVDTPDHVYYISGGSLFDYNKKEDTTAGYTSANKLSDDNVVIMEYNRDRKFLAVGYDNCNIDLVYDNGKTVNLPDIRDAVIEKEKHIKAITFSGDRMLVSTTFGLVIYDTKRGQVIDSGQYDKGVIGAVQTGDYILVNYGDYYLYGIEAGKSIRSIENFKKICWLNTSGFMPLNDRMAVFTGYEGSGIITVEDSKTDKVTKTIDATLHTQPSIVYEPLMKTASGDVLFVRSNIVNKFDGKSGAVSAVKPLPTVLNNCRLGIDSGLESVWAGDASGIGNYDMSGVNVTVKSDKSKPMGACSVAMPAFMSVSNDGRRIFVTNRGAGLRKPGGDGYGGAGMTVRQYTDVIIDGKLSEVTAKADSKTYSMGQQFKDADGKLYITNPQHVVADPDEEDVYFIASGSEGVFKVKGDKVVGQYSTANAPLTEPYGIFCYDLGFDKEGNMWVMTRATDSNESGLIMLPAAKRKLNPSQVTKSDWKKSVMRGVNLQKEGTLLICKNSNMIIMSDGGYETGLYIIDTKGTYNNTADDRFIQLNSFTDQDGKAFKPLYVLSLLEDSRGRVWVGTNDGIVEITNPSNLMSGDFTINHLKVPRNDGTNYADYLLTSQYIFDMTEDTSGRKWVATSESGIYVVSANGDEIIENFTNSNSPLTSNLVNCIESDPLSNIIYVGTQQGLLRYASTSSPGYDSYDEVVAYPNPVRPDYTGWITIKGLMDNSLVKIADAQGGVVYQTMSEGGMATWDGTNSSGARVKTGVYYVYASQGGEGGSSGKVVTKILVVN